MSAVSISASIERRSASARRPITAVRKPRGKGKPLEGYCQRNVGVPTGNFVTTDGEHKTPFGGILLAGFARRGDLVTSDHDLIPFGDPSVNSELSDFERGAKYAVPFFRLGSLPAARPRQLLGGPENSKKKSSVCIAIAPSTSPAPIRSINCFTTFEGESVVIVVLPE